METKLQWQDQKRSKTPTRRDWDKSEWFRRWLELIRQKPARGAVLAH